MESRGLDNRTKRAEILFHVEFPAVVIRSPGHARLGDRTIASLKPGEVLLRVAYTSTCATHFEVLDGSLGYYKTGVATYPIVPGHAFSARVVSLGYRVATLEEGDRVVGCLQGCGECPQCASEKAIRCGALRSSWRASCNTWGLWDPCTDTIIPAAAPSPSGHLATWR